MKYIVKNYNDRILLARLCILYNNLSYLTDLLKSYILQPEKQLYMSFLDSDYISRPIIYH